MCACLDSSSSKESACGYVGELQLKRLDGGPTKWVTGENPFVDKESEEGHRLVVMGKTNPQPQ